MKIFKNRFFNRALGFLMLASVAVACVYLDSVEYPETAEAGSVVSFKLNVRVEPAEDSNNERFVVAFLAPNSWNAAENTTITYTSSVDDGVKTMSLVPEDDLPRVGGGATWKEGIRSDFGVGPNVLNDMEWVVFWTDEVYSVVNGEKITATFDVQAKVGPDNVRAKLGFFVNNTGDGLTNDNQYYKLFFTDCFEVTGGEGAITDFCELHFNFAQPLTSTKDDIISLKFQGDIAENPLMNAEEVHLCATAYSSNGNSYPACNLNESTRMRKESEFGNSYVLSIWPADFFGIPEDEELERIEYSFVNEDKTVELMNEDSTPFTYFFNCD